MQIERDSEKFAAQKNTTKKENTMKTKAFLYTELQSSVPFDDVPWQRLNAGIKKEAGFINKTWLSGVGTQSVGGFYAFDSIENAEKFVTGYFPAEAKSFGVAQTTHIFDADVSEEASRDLNSLYY